MNEPLWNVTLLSQAPGVLQAPAPLGISACACDEQNGALVFRGGVHSSVKLIIASGQWLMVEKEGDKRE